MRVFGFSFGHDIELKELGVEGRSENTLCLVIHCNNFARQ
jgi:hypothetical protein